MKGRYFFIIAGFISTTISIFSQSFLIKAIATAIALISVGIYIGIALKDMEVNYKNKKRKGVDDDFNLALEVE